LGTRAGRKTRERSTFKNDRENEPDMTTYPLEFHRRSEQKWVLGAQASSGTPRAALNLVGRSQRRQRRSGQSKRRGPGEKQSFSLWACRTTPRTELHTEGLWWPDHQWPCF
jgi:hypothetical protein